MVMPLSEEQYWNVLLPILVREDGSVTSRRFEQEEKAYDPMLVKVFGRSIV